MRLLTTLLFSITFLSVLAFEGVVHGVKTTNGFSETFDIYIKGGLISIEGENVSGRYKIIVDRTKEEIFICIDDPSFGHKGYYHFTAEQLKRDKKFKVLSAVEIAQEKEINGEKCSGYSMYTDKGSAVLYASNSEVVDLTGLSKYMDDPVYELIDSFGVKNAIRTIQVVKENYSYSVELTEESTTVEASRFEIPAGYTEFEIKLNSK